MDALKKYFDVAAKIYSSLLEKGQTNISSFLTKKDMHAQILYAASNFDVLNINDNFLGETLSEIAKDNYLNAFVYLVALDLESIKNDSLIRYIKLNRDKTCSLTNDQRILIYPTYNNLDHYYHGHEIFQTMFKNLYFLDSSIFCGHDFKISNYYIDDNNCDNSIDVIFVPYPFNPELKDELSKSGTCKERQEESIYDKVFIKRVENAIKHHKTRTGIPLILFSAEIMGSKSIDRRINELMIENKEIVAFLAPSFHQINGEKKINSSILFVNEDRRTLLFEIQKMRPADLKNLIEQVENGILSIAVVNIKFLGKILFIICRDYLTDIFRNIIKSVVPDFVVVQCYTPSFKEFEDVMRKDSSPNTFIVAGNSCSAAKKEIRQLMMFTYRNQKNNNKAVSVEEIYCCGNEGLCLKNENCNKTLKISIKDSDSNYTYPKKYILLEKEEDGFERIGNN